MSSKNRLFAFKKILVLAPHTDDGELGCGGLIAKHIAAGATVTYAAFSTCEASLPAGFAPRALENECKAATASLGVQETIFYDYPVREFGSHRQAILDDMIKLEAKYCPDLVLLSAMDDVHQDHQVIYAEGLRAFKRCSVLGYELAWNNTGFSPAYFEVLSEQNVAMKVKALALYASQSHRSYMTHAFTTSLAVVRGVQCKAPLAEGFEVYRLVNS